MVTVLILVLVLAGAGLLVFAFRSSPQGLAEITSRLGRYGLAGTASTGATQVVHAAGGSNRAVVKSLDRFAARSSFGAKLANRLERADWKMSPGEFLTLSIAGFFAAAFIGLLVYGTLGLLAGAVIGAGAPQVYLKRRISRRKRKFVEQLADMAQMMGNSMRAGFSIVQSMEQVGREAAKPSSDEFERVVTEIKLGLPMDQALDHLIQRMPSEDLELMVVAINIQRQVGGNLSEILGVIARVIRERVRFERDLLTLTAQARYSSYIITGLPVGVAIVINLLDPEYESYLYTATIGHLMLLTSVCMLGLGFFFLNRIANIEV